jgi:ketosteroid isomerase-like protein
MRTTVIVLVLLLATSAFAGPVDDVRNAEIAFARAFADRDQTRFFSFVADDASFLSARGTLPGKQAIVDRWSKFFADKTAPFSWSPERVVVNAAGDLGLSTGPVLDPEGKQQGIYSSVWQKNAKGEWHVMFDGPGAPPPCPAPAK